MMFTVQSIYYGMSQEYRCWSMEEEEESDCKAMINFHAFSVETSAHQWRVSKLEHSFKLFHNEKRCKATLSLDAI